jgi:uncharacterized pyridoxal phosphate-dependent enzyme
MDLHKKYGLSKIVNASGSFTPLGVSRSSIGVASAAADALQDFFVVDELQAVASKRIADYAGADAATVVHCAAAGVTLSIAAVMTEGKSEKVAALPNAEGMSNRVVLPATHAINYGHPIVQDIRLAGAVPVLAGSESACSIEEIEAALSDAGTACLLLVASRLVRGDPLDMSEAVALARSRQIPVIIDGAAQDMRIPELLATGVDAVVISAQKYLASPTAGIVIGSASHIAAVRAQEKGIGRAMKASKEAIIGLLKAIEERQDLDIAGWRYLQDEKVATFLNKLRSIPGVKATAVPDPVGMPFSRIALQVDREKTRMTAIELAETLRSGTPSVWLMEHNAASGELVLELVPLSSEECNVIVDRIGEIVGRMARQRLGQRV